MSETPTRTRVARERARPRTRNACFSLVRTRAIARSLTRSLARSLAQPHALSLRGCGRPHIAQTELWADRFERFGFNFDAANEANGAFYSSAAAASKHAARQISTQHSEPNPILHQHERGKDIQKFIVSFDGFRVYRPVLCVINCLF